MKNTRFISLITIVTICMSLFANITVMAENETYTADFTKLEAKTYGASTDIIALDDYTTAYLTSKDTYVDSNHVIHLTGTNAGKGAYTNGSYVQFIAPSDGTVSFTINYANYFVDSTYTGYSSASVDLKANQKLTIGERDSDQSTISAITFTPKTTPTVTDIASPYTSPQTTWDFDTYLPAELGKNVPVISGAAEYNDGDIKFKSDAKATGTLSVDFDEPIKNNVEFLFDVTEHKDSGSKYTLKGRYIEYKILNSEDEEIVFFSAHPYDANSETSNLIKIGGTAIDKTKSEILTAFNKRGTGITTSVDYHARKVTITMGSSTFEGEIPASAMKDIAKLEFSVRLTDSVSADRYITLDNVAVKEFTSTEQAAPAGEIANGYEAKTYGTLVSRVKEPSEAGEYPLVIFLSSKSRFGTDNEGQLYQAQYFFDKLADDAILAAPQTETAWNTDALKTYIAAAKTEYNPSKVIVIGQGEGADAAYALADTADKIIPINGTSDITETTAKVWAFAGYLDENISAIRTTVSALQKAKADVMYTEFPFDSSNIAAKVAETTGLTDWILKDAENTKVVDLVLFAGQSNMAGRGDYADATECKAGHGFEYHSVTEPGVLTTVNEPFGKYENNDTVNDNGGNGVDRRSGDMVSSFMESYYSVTGVPIVGVQCSRGGTESSWWYRDGGSGKIPKDEAIERYNEAKAYLEASGYTIRNKFMVWCQGETDADNNRGANTWKTNVTNLFTDLKNSTPITNMFIVRIGHCKSGSDYDATKDPRYKAINLAGKELADANDDITAVASFYTDEYFALMRDAYHYYQPAYNSIGEIAGNNTAVTLYKDKGEWIEYPEPEDVKETVDGVFEIKSSDASVDVTALTMYDSTTYRMYKADGSYETVTATEGKVANTTGGEVTIVPEYKFEFTNQTNPTDKNIAGYVKTAQGSYTKEKGYGLTSDNYSINENGCKVDASPIKADLAEGFYDITVYRLGGARADIYSKGKLIANNTTSAEAQNRGGSSALMEIPSVKLSEGSIDLTFGNITGNERIASVKIVRVPEKYRKPVIWIAGDSESSNYYPFDADGDDLDSNKIMITGFGQQLGKLLSDKYSISNYGQPSATVKTWYDECFESVNNLMQAGDTILVDFGINDAISSSNKISVDEMKECMKSIFTTAKAKNVQPILVSPLWNSKYQSKSYFTYNKDTDTNAMTAFAQECGVPCIDLNKWSQLYKDKAIVETSDSDWVKNNYHVADELHQTQHSALLNASFIAAGMKSLGYETTDFSYNYTDISSIGDGNIRGTKTENKRVYSVAAAEKFMKDGTIMKPGITIEGTTVTVIANPDVNDTPVLIHVTRSVNGALETVKTYNLTFSNNTASVDNLSLNTGDELYVWSSLSGMKPLAAKKPVNNESGD